MKPELRRTMRAVAKLFDNPLWKGSQKDVADWVGCDERTARRCLMDLWINNNTYVCAWVRSNGGDLPVFALRNNGQEDAPKKSPKISVHMTRAQQIKNPPTPTTGPPTIGFWGV